MTQYSKLNHRQRKKRDMKKAGRYSSRKLFSIVVAHSTDISWYDAIDEPTTKQCMSRKESKKLLSRLPVGSYAMFFEKRPIVNGEDLSGWTYVMKNHCDNCKKDCGTQYFMMKKKTKFGKPFEIVSKRQTQCELKNKLKGIVTEGAL
jgi:hypothetical protein